MLLSVQGAFHNGFAQPSDPIEGREGQPGIMTVLEETPVEAGSAPDDHASAYDTLGESIDACQLDTVADDFAPQHDHDLYAKPKEPNQLTRLKLLGLRCANRQQTSAALY